MRSLFGASTFSAISIGFRAMPPGPAIIIGSAETDANGNWSIVTAPAVEGEPVFYWLTLGNAVLSLTDSFNLPYFWVSDAIDGPFANFGTLEIVDDPEPAQIFSVLDRAWNHIVTEGGQDPGIINTHYPDQCIVGTGPRDCWDPAAETIRLEADTNVAPDVTMHEYGHALLHYAFGGFPIGSGGDHSFADDIQSGPIAFDEGWATAFALSVCPDGKFEHTEVTTTDWQR